MVVVVVDVDVVVVGGAALVVGIVVEAMGAVVAALASPPELPAEHAAATTAKRISQDLIGW